ncbi:uncharacterized protein LOC112081868 [Eutrema salsugineum]|uniref:uncharacterized protein LOC112081868 n=1 Tax=Eutrema salsugineum TaxID=72664 RepID=UPI000CED1183|nr:uncharacterized protein LOC112081868 [Eutrema salsugineum]
MAVNGELVGFFPGKKGLRQGDPVSSSLFVLAMEILSKLLDKAVHDHVFTPHPSCNQPLITHLSFADDVLIFFDGSASSLSGILTVLNSFQRSSGLALSLRKSCLFLDGNNLPLVREMAGRFGLQQGSLPVRYLGLPLMPHKLRAQDFQPLVDKVKARISTWTIRHLNFAGRLQLIQSICNAFLWSGAPNSAKSAKVAWDSVCTPKEAGGLGLKRLHDLNQVFGLKLIWLLFAGNGLLWVNSGTLASFWHDDWTHLGPLIDLTGTNGPRITGIPSSSTVAGACSNGSPPGLFSTSKTWDQLHPSPPPVPWHKAVWPKVRIPKHAFIFWVATMNRMPSRDRLRSWGLNVPADCLLCGSCSESRDHLFFSCSYSAELLSSIFSYSGIHPPLSFDACLDWIMSPLSPNKLKVIANLVIQSVVYSLWKERNVRLHSATSNPVQVLIKEIHLILRAKLASLDRADHRRLIPGRQIFADSYLYNWFRFFQS